MTAYFSRQLTWFGFVHRQELEPSEYEETKRETLAQMAEFNGTLTKMSSGNVSLIDEFSTMKLVRS